MASPDQTRELRSDYIPKESYISPAYARREKDRMWPRVWQVACRSEDLPNPHEYVVYDILDESVIVSRSADGALRAFHNVCQHRGRRLLNGRGKASSIRCKFHGWTWKSDGTLVKVVDRDDWEGCPGMTDGDLALKPVAVDEWGGFVFVNLDTDAIPLSEYLSPATELLSRFEFETMRIRWAKTVRVGCNWKVALDAFSEGYHVQGTHPQLLDIGGDDRTRSFAMGDHTMFDYGDATRPIGAPSPRTGKAMPKDLRPGLARFHREMEDTLKALFSPRSVAVAEHLTETIPTNLEANEVMEKMIDLQKEAALGDGAGWPDITPEDMASAGADWHIFPNLAFLFNPDAMLAYRARPDGDNPDSCIFDIWSLVRFAPGEEPDVDVDYIPEENSWKIDTEERLGLILAQDFSNMEDVQRGMKSSGFDVARTNPRSEIGVSHIQQVLDRYVRS